MLPEFAHYISGGANMTLNPAQQKKRNRVMQLKCLDADNSNGIPISWIPNFFKTTGNLKETLFSFP